MYELLVLHVVLPLLMCCLSLAVQGQLMQGRRKKLRPNAYLYRQIWREGTVSTLLVNVACVMPSVGGGAESETLVGETEGEGAGWEGGCLLWA